MSDTTDILLLGRNPVLQHTRTYILNRKGFRVDRAVSLAEMKSCLAVRPYALLVLCHSLSDAERGAAICLATSFLPEVRILALEKVPGGVVVPSFVPVLHTVSGPEGFCSVVRDLVDTVRPAIHPGRREVTVAEFQGAVKWFNNAKGYGFLGRKGGGPDVFAQFSSIESDGYKSLQKSEEVTFEGAEGDKGCPQADQVQVIRKK